MFSIVTSRTGKAWLPTGVAYNPDSLVGEHRPKYWFPLREHAFRRNYVSRELLSGNFQNYVFSARPEASNGDKNRAYPFSCMDGVAMSTSSPLTATAGSPWDGSNIPWCVASVQNLSSLLNRTSWGLGDMGVDTYITARTVSAVTSTGQFYAYTGGSFYINNVQVTDWGEVGVWNYWLIGYDGTSFFAYKNGELHKKTSTGVTADVAQPVVDAVRVGYYKSGSSTNEWNGHLAEVIIFKTAPTQRLAQELYQPDSRFNHYQRPRRTYFISVAAAGGFEAAWAAPSTTTISGGITT